LGADLVDLAPTDAEVGVQEPGVGSVDVLGEPVGPAPVAGAVGVQVHEALGGGVAQGDEAAVGHRHQILAYAGISWRRGSGTAGSRGRARRAGPDTAGGRGGRPTPGAP